MHLRLKIIRSTPSVKFIAFVVASITRIANGTYMYNGNNTSLFHIGIIISVMLCVFFIIHIIYIIEIISRPIILYDGFSPLVLCSTNFLKSSINPTIPNPTIKNTIGIILFAKSF